MTTHKNTRGLDGRDEILLALIAGMIPFVTVGSMIF